MFDDLGVALLVSLVQISAVYIGLYALRDKRAAETHQMNQVTLSNFSALLNTAVSDRDKLRADNDNLKERVDKVEDRLQTKMNEVDALRAKLAAQDKDHAEAIAAMVAAHNNALSRLRAELAGERDRMLAELKRQHKQEMDKLRRDHKTEMDRLKAQHDESRAAWEASLAEANQKIIDLEIKLGEEMHDTIKAPDDEPPDRAGPAPEGGEG